ncbi:hypothetical protein LSH36_2088g00003 [Paralvinella palmiformis]|uniref:Uncharacterized protein n=1 Tax=Paralvinella palmiformis TaxID=53620 RepID=A0AAD9IR67_9ANNE|nr:hypothetical protein LSH36_2088g00003 [Paralvinella palmiformis]
MGKTEIVKAIEPSAVSLVSEANDGENDTVSETSETEYRDPYCVSSIDRDDHIRVTVIIPKLKKAFLRNKPSGGGKIRYRLNER